MRILVSGGSGVLGRALIPLLTTAGHDVVAPRHAELDLYDAAAVRGALLGADVVFHLATRIPPAAAISSPDAWQENDRLRSEATPILAGAALEAGARTFVYPSVTFVYPAEGDADEDTPAVSTPNLASTVQAEAEVARFTAAGRSGVVLRLGLLWGPGTNLDAPSNRYGAALNVLDAGAALFAALDAPPGLYNVVGNGGRVSNARFKAATGWQPAR